LRFTGGGIKTVFRFSYGEEKGKGRDELLYI